ncbi:MAG: substrate-binding domain-containing protein [Cytophagales bacterium]|nr:substrate-binding domain-containing protein [Armatimonadota bacterium]
MDTIGVVMAYNRASVTTDPYLGACLDGILYVSKQHRQKTVIFTEDNWEMALQGLPSYCDGHCDGLLLIIPRTHSEIVPALEARGDVPFVLVGDSPLSESLVSVDVDNVAAAAAATAHLTLRGHTKIAAFCGNPELRSNSQRLAGYCQALESAGLPHRQEYLFPGEYRHQHGYDNACRLLAEFPDPADRPTAILCLNDAIARGACDALLDASVRIPEEISVIGIDDSAYATVRTPHLTTVRQDVRSVGEAATEVLLACIEGHIKPGYQRLIQTELVKRSTTTTAIPPAGLRRTF